MAESKIQISFFRRRKVGCPARVRRFERTMRSSRSYSSLALVGALLVLAAPSIGNAASFQTLGHLDAGLASTRATAVSGDGSTVVGQSSTNSGLRSFTWDATHGMRALSDLGAGDTFAPAALSADGSTLAGSVSRHAPGVQEVEASIFDEVNGLQLLGDYPGGQFRSVVNDISADGSIAVGFGSPSSGQRGFLWDAANPGLGLQPISDVFGNTVMDVSGVSADGLTIVGTRQTPNRREAFIRDSGGAPPRQLVGLDTISSSSNATTISADGSTVIGQFLAPSNSVKDSGFVWDALNGPREIGDLSGGTSEFGSFVSGVSSDGSIVVGTDFSGADGSGRPEEAFIWDEVHGIRSLEVVLTSLGVDLTGWRLDYAYGISDDGRMIVGEAANPNGNTEAFLAIIPEPSVGLLVGLGLAALSARSRREKSSN